MIQSQLSNQIPINSIKISNINNRQAIKVVHNFLQDVANKNYPVIVNLNNSHQWKNDALKETIDLILPSCSILVVSYDIIICLFPDQQDMLVIVEKLLQMGPKVVVVHDQKGKRFVANKDDHDKLNMLQGDYSVSCSDNFVAAIAAYVTHNSISFKTAIEYSHLYSTMDKASIPPYLYLVPKLTFTQELWSSVHDIYNRMIQLRFLNEMLNDTLNPRIYDYYIIQDYYYFIDRGNMLNNLIMQCTNNEEVLEFLSIQNDKNKKFLETLLNDNNLALSSEFQIVKTPACLDYTKLLFKLGNSSEDCSWMDGLIALLPCTLVYAKIGDWMIQSGQCPATKRYSDFIDAYRDQAKRDRLLNFLELVNRVVDSCSYEQRQKLEQIFQKVCKYEYAFWDDAYSYGVQNIDGIIKYNLKTEKTTSHE